MSNSGICITHPIVNKLWIYSLRDLARSSCLSVGFASQIATAAAAFLVKGKEFVVSPAAAKVLAQGETQVEALAWVEYAGIRVALGATSDATPVRSLVDEGDRPVAQFLFGSGRLSLRDLDVLNLVGGDQVMGAIHGFVGVEGVPLAEKLPVKPGRPDVAVAQVDELRVAVLRDLDQKRPRHLRPFRRRVRRSVHHSRRLRSQHGDGPRVPFFLTPKEVQ